jgi:23S rRNA pseudouridine2457 synthase
LLILTSDGALQHRLTDPKFQHPRTYWAQVEGIVTPHAIQQLESGVLIQGRKTLPAKARMLAEEATAMLPPRRVPIRVRQAIPTSWLELTLTEGRNRQVRRMTAAVALPTLRLIRVRIGSLPLAPLTPGQHRELSSTDIQRGISR